MKLLAFAVHDSAMGAYHPPFFVNASGLAVRGFGDQVLKQDSEFNRHPSDFSLWEIGSYDDETGQMVPAVPKQVSRAKDWITEA